MIVVSGVTGFVGRHVAERLAAAGVAGVRGVARRRDVDLPAGVEFVAADLTRPATLRTALAGATTVIHSAAITADRKPPYPGAYWAVNAEGTRNLVAAARDAGVSRIIVVSGLGTQPGAEGSYMATRWAMEEAVRESGLDHLLLQPSVLFGRAAPFVSALAGLVRATPIVPIIGSGGQRLQPLWVGDLATCVLRALDDPRLKGAIAVGGAEQLSFREVVETIAAALGKRRLLLPLPIPLARFQARVLTAVLPSPPLTPAALELFDFPNTTEIDAVERHFGFRPRGFREYVQERGIEA